MERLEQRKTEGSVECTPSLGHLPFQGHAFIGDTALQGQTRKDSVPPISRAGSEGKGTWKSCLHLYSGQWPGVTVLTLTALTTGQWTLSYLHGGDRGGQLAFYHPLLHHLDDRCQGQPAFHLLSCQGSAVSPDPDLYCRK